MLELSNIFELFLKILPAQVFISIASSLSNIVNGLVIGNNLSDSAMIAMGLVTPMLNLLTGIASIISSGGGIIVGNYMGKGDTKKVNEAYSISVINIVIIGIFLTVICYLGAPLIAKLLNADAYTLNDTIAYIRGVSIGIIPMLLMPCLMTFLQMCNKSGISLVDTIILAIFNAIFGLLNVHVFEGGIFGIGLATSISRYLVVAIIIMYFGNRKDLISFDPKAKNSKMMLEILAYGSPASLAGILYSIRNVFINSYAAQVGGNTAVNALAILGACGGFFDAFNIGVGSTLTMLASVYVGERNPRSLRGIFKVSCIVGVAIAAFKLVIVYLFSDQIIALFGGQAEVLDSARDLLITYTWSAPFNMITLTLIGISQCLGRVKMCNIMYLENCIITPFICCVFLSKFIGISAIWSCYYLAELVSLFFFYVNASIKNKKPVTSIDEILHLDKEFTGANKYIVSLRGIDDATNISKGIESFCKDQGIDSRRSMLAGLCMEELAVDIIEHAFDEDRKENTIDVFTCVENDEVLLRLRDNCVPFDMKGRAKIFNPDDPCENVGIRMVAKVAKEMNYTINFGMNVNTIRL